MLMPRHMLASNSAASLSAPPSPSQEHCKPKSRSRRHARRNRRSSPPVERGGHIRQLLLALFSATLSRIKLYAHRVHGLLIYPLLRLPGVALKVMRALWRGLMDSWPGQLCLALFTSMASIRYSFSCSLTRSSRQALQAGQNRPGMAANLGTTVSLLWGCLRLKSQVELSLARPDFAAAFQRSLQRQRLRIELEQQRQHHQHHQQLRSSAHDGPACDAYGPPQRLMLPDQPGPGGDITLLCSQEMTATILSFLRQQQAGVQDGAFWVESPRTIHSEDGINSSSPGEPDCGAHDKSDSTCTRRAGGVSITFCSSPVARVSHSIPRERPSCSSVSPKTSRHHQDARPPFSTPVAAGFDQQHAHGGGARTAGSDNPVWHTNPCCVTTPAAPQEEASPGSAVAAGCTTDTAQSRLLPLEVAAPGSEGKAENGVTACSYKSPPSPSLEVQRRVLSERLVAADLLPDLRQPCGLDQAGLVAAAVNGELTRSSEDRSHCTDYKAHHHHHHHQQQQQLQVCEGLVPQPPLRGPQPGGASPVKQSRGQRSRMWDMQSSCASSSTPRGVAGTRKTASASVDGLGRRSDRASVRSSGVGLESDDARCSVANSVEGPACRWALLNSSSDSGAAWSSRSFGASEARQACGGGSAALRFAQRLAQETGATDGRAPPPAFLLPHAPPAAQGGTGLATPAAAPTPFSVESAHGGMGSSRSSSGSAAAPQFKAARAVWGGGAAEGDGEASSSSSSSRRQLLGVLWSTSEWLA
mmetsp:Transcript_25815/g.66507  ORF Transcript_25815/g.66507 Transcript_25815/m.66507 type:complete len:755 (+) Transcript_25815:182-2446(+)